MPPANDDQMEKARMNRNKLYSAAAAAVLLATASGIAQAQTRVNYGRITNVELITDQNRRAQTGGAVLGGALGAAATSNNRSRSTRAVNTGLGVVAGQQLARVATQNQTFEYTVLIDGTQTVRVMTDEAGLRIGDCVAVERGSNFNNLRLVDDARCAPRRAPQPAQPAAPAAPARAQPVSADAQRAADACVQAKERLLDANTDEEFERAYRRVRLLCQD
jgi:outer membrane lipoprotein SlyB